MMAALAPPLITMKAQRLLVGSLFAFLLTLATPAAATPTRSALQASWLLSRNDALANIAAMLVACSSNSRTAVH